MIISGINLLFCFNLSINTVNSQLFYRFPIEASHYQLSYKVMVFDVLTYHYFNTIKNDRLLDFSKLRTR